MAPETRLEPVTRRFTLTEGRSVSTLLAQEHDDTLPNPIVAHLLFDTDMIPRSIKLPWFFIACWFPLLMPALMFNAFLSHQPLLGDGFETFFTVVASFFGISLAAMVLDLWTSKKDRQQKIMWTLLLVFLYLPVTPFYWTRHVLERKGSLTPAVWAFAGICVASVAYLVYLFVG